MNPIVSNSDKLIINYLKVSRNLVKSMFKSFMMYFGRYLLINDRND